MKQALMITALVLGMLAGPQRAIAAENMESVGYLLEHCKAHFDLHQNEGRSTKWQSSAYCAGIITGFTHGYGYATARTFALMAGPKKPGRNDEIRLAGWCAPKEATTNQLAAVFVRWGENHPNRWHEIFSVGLVAAFQEAWPCRK